MTYFGSTHKISDTDLLTRDSTLVVRARNKLDGRFYAVKKIKSRSASSLNDVLSEIIILSQLNHPYVVRYYNAWLEDEIASHADQTAQVRVFHSCRQSFVYLESRKYHRLAQLPPGKEDTQGTLFFPYIVWCQWYSDMKVERYEP